MTARELYELIAVKKVYPPKYILDLLLKESQGKDIKKFLAEMVKRAEIAKYTEPEKGAYVLSSKVESKKVKRIDTLNNKEKVYDSIRAAALELGDEGKKGNIVRAIKSKRKAYGYRWEEA